MKYNLSKLMKKAWSLFRTAAKKAAITFGEALRRAWAWLKVQNANKAIVEAAADALGIEEAYHTWAGWQALGRMVIHTSEALFKVEVADPTTKKGTRIQSYFIYSDTQPICQHTGRGRTSFTSRRRKSIWDFIRAEKQPRFLVIDWRIMM